MTLDSLPADMTSRRAWVLWNAQKLPLQPNGQPARANDSATWHDFEDCRQAVGQHGSQGIGFELGPPLVGIDLDNCIYEPSGGALVASLEIMERFAGAYIEQSPSGKGLHIICRGTKPEGCRSRADLPDGSRLEFYGGGRYFTVTGQHNGRHSDPLPDCQEAIDWLVGEYLQPSTVTTSTTDGLPSFDDHRKTELASQYLATMDAAVSGSGGHNATYRAAVKMVEGFDLTNEQAFALLAAEFNPRCNPPWSDADLQRKVDQARKVAGQQNAIGYLMDDLPSERPSLVDQVDFSALLAEIPGEAVGDPSDEDLIADPGPMPEALLQPAGWLGEMVRHTVATSIKPQPNFALAGALAFGATILGRRVADQFGGRTNLYIVTIAETGSGKERAREVNAEALATVDMHVAEENQMLGPEEWASPQGLLNDLSARGVAYYPIDEFGYMLQAATSERQAGPLAGISSTLLKLWGAAKSSYKGSAYAATGAKAGKGVRINQPHCVVFGTTTGSTFYESLTGRQVADGLLNRVLIFETEDKYPDEPDEIGSGPIPDSIIDAAKWWRENTPAGDLSGVTGDPVRLQFSHDASARLKTHRRAITAAQRDEDGSRAALWSRTAEKASKIAMIHACSRQGAGVPTVEIGDVEYGIALANYLTRRMVYAVQGHVADSQAEANAKKILRIIREIGGCVPKSKITAKCTAMGKPARDEALETLEEAGRIDKGEAITTGRKATFYWEI